MRIKLSAWKLLCSWQRRDRSSSAPGGAKSSNFSRLIQFSTVQHCSVFSLRSVCKICYEREAARLHWTNDWTFGHFVTPKMIKMECWSQVVLGRERQIWNLLRYCFVVHVAFCLSFSRHACKQPTKRLIGHDDMLQQPGHVWLAKSVCWLLSFMSPVKSVILLFCSARRTKA